MRRKLAYAFFTGIVVTLFFACKTEVKVEPEMSENDKLVLTELIQYDVYIKSPDQDQEWYVQNMEGRYREKFVKRILDAANSGEYRLYNYFFNTPLTQEQIDATFNKVDSVTLQRETPPYDWYDTVMVNKLDSDDITKVRFLEEWYIDEDKLDIEKKIVGIAPMMENYNEEGKFRGYVPMYWIYLDDKYPIKE